MSKILMIRQEGGSRVLSITKIIPLDWRAVEVVALKHNTKDVESITVKIIKVR